MSGTMRDRTRYKKISWNKDLNVFGSTKVMLLQSLITTINPLLNPMQLKNYNLT